MTTLKATASGPAATRADVLVVGLAQDARKRPVLAPGAESVNAAFDGRLARLFADVGASGSNGEVTRIASLGAVGAPAVVAVGLGKQSKRYEADALRRASGGVARALAGSSRILTTLALVNGDEPDDATLSAVAEGLLLGAYTFDEFRRDSLEGRKKPIGAATLVVSSPRAAAAALARATVLADSICLARNLVNTPPDVLPPAAFADRARAIAKEAGLTVEVLDEKALAKGGFGGILGVGQGSGRPPRLVKVSYRPTGATADTPKVALVGKGLTFDSGGLSLKPAGSMESMKSDMAGAASVLATAVAAAKLQIPVAVTAWCPLAENMPSGDSIRPSDVLTMYGGKTVEVLNTDAEGRLVLADAIVRASEEDPALIVDVATLTGAALVALGSRTFGVMGSEGLRDQVVSAAGRAGDQAWPMPLPADIRPSLDSEVADICNIGDRNGGMLSAGLFLKEFVPDGVPWAHLDIAGPAWNGGAPWGHTPKGGTGVPVATLVALLEDISVDAAAGSDGEDL
ncbi:MAG TPA: leucyl aminopeptidase [Mycobacteriales bacterium]|nr:leucyl aminopeptidase [Mycobacteriales bacterium]